MSDPMWVDCWENQRYFPFKSWCTKLLPSDRWNWSSKNGKEHRTKSMIEPLPGHEWAAPWSVDLSPTEAGEGGWAYALDFKRSWHPKMKKTDFVRRRRWIRRMQPIQSEGRAVVETDLSNSSEVRLKLDANALAIENSMAATQLDPEDDSKTRAGKAEGKKQIQNQRIEQREGTMEAIAEKRVREENERKNRAKQMAKKKDAHGKQI